MTVDYLITAIACLALAVGSLSVVAVFGILERRAARPAVARPRYRRTSR